MSKIKDKKDADPDVGEEEEEEEEEDEEFIVEKVDDPRMKGGKKEYLLKWKSYPEFYSKLDTSEEKLTRKMSSCRLVVYIFFYVTLQSHLLSVVNACSASEPCNPKSCCSKWGSCGFGTDFCNNECLADCDAEPSCSATKVCSPTACCSKFGNCGFGSDFCGDGCQSGCDSVKPEGECSSRNPCKVFSCCSEFGNCGYGPSFCGKGCQADCDAKPECGEFAEEKECPLGVCCSKWGNCGLTEEFCGDGCQSGCSKRSRPHCSPPPPQLYIGYYASWAASRKCSAYSISDIDATNYTHLNYAFGIIRDGVMIEPSADQSTSLREFAELKKVNSDLKVLISVGGWAFNDPGITRDEFHNIVSTSSNRQKFIASVSKFLTDYNFDGIDIDYEYPGAEDRGGKKEDTQNFLQLVSDMRGAFGSKYLITIAAPASYWYLRHFKIGKMSKYLDWINLMTYDFHGTWDRDIASLGPYVKSHTDIMMIEEALDLFFRDGVPSTKIALGLGFYGRAFTLENSKCTDIGCKFKGPSNAGKCTDAPGTLALFEINAIMKEKKISPRLDEDSMSEILSWDDQWVAFDDDLTLSYKRNFAAKSCLRGVMIWSIDQGEKPIKSVPKPGTSLSQTTNIFCIFSTDWSTYYDEGCASCGKRVFSSRLMNIKGSWEEACPKTVGKPPGHVCSTPAYCKNQGIFEGEVGYFVVDDDTCDDPNWDKYSDDGCVEDKCGVHKYSARLWNIDGSWEDACASTPGSPPGVKCQTPHTCTNKGFLGGIRGEWEVNDPSCGAKEWGTFSDDGCSRPAYRQYSAVLYGIPSGVTWEGCCESFGATIKGQTFSRPSRCQKATLNLNIRGQFDVVDVDCLPNWNQCKTGKRRKRQPGGCRAYFIDDIFSFAVLAALTVQYPPARTLPCPDPIVNYQRGYLDRVERLYAIIRPCNLDTGSDTTTATRLYARTMGLNTDDAGHIVANRLGGNGGATYNIFPQSPNFNRGTWRQQEAIVYNDLAIEAARGNYLTPVAICTYRFIYAGDYETRPVAVLYEFRLPGGSVLTNDIRNPD